jgi:hypothetical protein
MDTDLVKLIYKLCPVCCVQINNLIWALTVATTRTAVLVYESSTFRWRMAFGVWRMELLFIIFIISWRGGGWRNRGK